MLNFLDRFKKKTPNIKFNKNSTGGGGKTGRQT
jgi:hypothetical protein